MDLSKQEIELFLSLPGLCSKTSFANFFSFGLIVQNSFSKQEMELSKREMELLIPFPISNRLVDWVTDIPLAESKHFDLIWPMTTMGTSIDWGSWLTWRRETAWARRCMMPTSGRWSGTKKTLIITEWCSNFSILEGFLTLPSVWRWGTQDVITASWWSMPPTRRLISWT